MLAFVPGEEIPELKKDIWVRAVLRNSWHHMDTDNPLEAISDTLLFKTIELAFTQGMGVASGYFHWHFEAIFLEVTSELFC